MQSLQCNAVFLILKTTYKVVTVTLHCKAEETDYLNTLGSTASNLIFKLQQICIIQFVTLLFLLHLPLGRHSKIVAIIVSMQTGPICLLTPHNGKSERSYYHKILCKKSRDGVQWMEHWPVN